MKAGNWIIVAILAILAVLFGIMWMNASNKVSGAEKKAEDAQKLYENASATLSDIQTSLDAMGSDLLGEIIGGDEVPGSTPEDRRARLISNISNMRSQIEADKKKIAELERQLKQVKGQRDGHLRALNNLKASLADKTYNSWPRLKSTDARARLKKNKALSTARAVTSTRSTTSPAHAKS